MTNKSSGSVTLTSCCIYHCGAVCLAYQLVWSCHLSVWCVLHESAGWDLSQRYPWLQRSIQRELFDSEGLVGTPGTSDSAKPVKDGLDTQESPQLVAAA